MNNASHSTSSLEVSTTVLAEEWNQFLASVPDNHHLQTTWWAELKSPSRWEAAQLAVKSDGKIIAGLQLLHRRFGLWGRLGYVPRGPVALEGAEAWTTHLMTALLKLAREKRLRYLTVQPPRGGVGFSAALIANGFVTTPFQIAPTATVLIDVRHSAEALLARMRSSNRRALRKAMASSLQVRVGTEVDMPVFHRLLTATGQRHGFVPPGLNYFERMWRLFAGANNIVLFLAERGGEPVAGELDIVFGDTLVSKRAGWSGKYAKEHPNELVVWTAMNWAREQGLKYYDMEGFDPELARLVVKGAQVPDAAKLTHHWFKLGFGGEVVVLPDNYEIVQLPIIGVLHRVVWGRWMSLRLRRWLLKRGRLL